MRADHNAKLSFHDAMLYAILDQLNTFRLASTKTGTRGQPVRGLGVGLRLRLRLRWAGAGAGAWAGAGAAADCLVGC